MTSSPLTVSVVIPCYNAAGFIAETLASVVAQTSPVDEIVVVDDGSTDGSAAIAESFGSLVRVVRQENRGVAVARNRGVAEARGDVIAFIDADDAWHPEKIAMQRAYLQAHPECGAVMTSVARFTDDTSKPVAFLRATDEEFRQRTLQEYLFICWINQSAVAVRSEFARAVPYLEGVTDAEDIIQSIELRLRTTIGAIPDVLSYYRMHPAQATRQGGHNIRSTVYVCRWAIENYARLDVPSPAEAIEPILRRAARQAMHHYWKRNLKQFKYERDQILQLWPRHLEPPAELTGVVLPRFVLKLRDLVWG